MKKIIYFLAAGAFLVSCNRDGNDDSLNGGAQSRTAVLHFDASELPAVTPMAESFGMNAKAAVQLNYTYRAFAEGPTGTGHVMQPTGIYIDGDVVFVSWHSSDGPIVAGATSSLYGSITAYKQSGIGQYTFTDRIDFTDADYHELTAHRNSTSGNIEVFAVGQRNEASSGYLLSGHNGAVVTRVDYDYINDEFWEPSVSELPLPGVSANDIVAGASHLYIACGNGLGTAGGGLYEVDRALERVERVNANDITDGRSLVADETSTGSASSTMYVLDRAGIDYRLHSFTTTVGGGWSGSVTDYSDITFGTGPIDLDKDDLTWADDFGGVSNPENDLIASFGNAGVYQAGPAAGTMSSIKNLGTAFSTAYDPGLNVLYYVGESKVFVLAMPGFTGGALINDYDVIGEFVPPTGGVFVGDLNAREMTVYQTRNIALAVGGDRATENGGVYFLQRDKN